MGRALCIRTNRGVYNKCESDTYSYAHSDTGTWAGTESYAYTDAGATV